jgi:V/A-type H+-transporting ATPase subunit K
MVLSVAAPAVSLAFSTEAPVADATIPAVQGEQAEGHEESPAGRIAAVGYGLAALGAALAVGLCAIGTGYAQGKIGTAGGGALAEKPELSGTMIILVAIPETAVILGFVIAITLLGKL